MWYNSNPKQNSQMIKAVLQTSERSNNSKKTQVWVFVPKPNDRNDLLNTYKRVMNGRGGNGWKG